jgi:hypothetical protein
MRQEVEPEEVREEEEGWAEVVLLVVRPEDEVSCGFGWLSSGFRLRLRFGLESSWSRLVADPWDEGSGQ